MSLLMAAQQGMSIPINRRNMRISSCTYPFGLSSTSVRRRQCRTRALFVTASTASYMEDFYLDQAQRVWQSASQLQQPVKYIVGIAGVPGSGKSTTAIRVAEQINALSTTEQQAAMVVQMDGFHYYRKQLDAMPDPVEAHARRGAHWTFDAHRFVQAMTTIRKSGQASLPSFDHAKGDPVEDDVIVLPSHAVILVEGLYLLYDEEPWAQVKGLLDESWFVDTDIDAALQRVVERQVGNGAPLEEASHRVASNDRPNAYLVDVTKDRADLLLPRLPLRQN